MQIGLNLALTLEHGGAGAPTLDMTFTGTGNALDSRITFTRASTGTFFDSAGILTSAAINAPRFDYNPATLAAQGLLIEEQRTNLLTYSADFGNAIWSKNQSTVTTDATVAPDNTTTADKLVENTANSQHSISVVSVLTTGIQYTISVFAKSAERSIILLGAVKDDGNFVGRYFNLATGTSTASFGTPDSWSISNAGNGWYRCVVTITNSATGSSDSVGVYLVDSGTNTTYTGNGTSGIFLFGAQVEAGAFPTSYIPTTTTALTRSADVASVNTLSPWFNASAGTLFAEFNIPSALTSGSGPRLFTLQGSGGAAIDEMPLFVVQATGKAASFNAFTGGVNAGRMDASPAFVANTVIKAAAAYATNDRAVTAGGAAPTTSTTAYTIPTITLARLGTQDTVGNSSINGYLRRITYYPRRLSNAELQAITA